MRLQTLESLLFDLTTVKPEIKHNVFFLFFVEEPRIVHEYESLLFYAKSPHSKVLPANWIYICEKMPSIVKQEVNLNDRNNNATASRNKCFKKSFSHGSFTNSSSFDTINNNNSTNKRAMSSANIAMSDVLKSSGPPAPTHNEI